MKVLVTGASGFVGGHLCTALVKSGHEVYGLIRNPKNSSYDFHVVKGDLSLLSIQKWINELPDKVDAVIHTAGVVHSFNAHIFEEVNFLGTQWLEQELKKKYSDLQFIFTSSLAAVGPSAKDLPHTEKTPLNPPSLYGKSKKKAEEYLIHHKDPSWKLTIVRPPMVIGPKDPAVLDVFKMVKSRIILGTGFSGMKKEYSFVCVHDLVELLIKCLAPTQEKVRTYFPAYPLKVTFNEIISSIKEEMKVSTMTLPVPMFIVRGLAITVAGIRKIKPFDFRLTPDKIHELSPKYWVVNSEKSIHELGMKYQWNLKDTISITYQDYKKRNWI